MPSKDNLLNMDGIMFPDGKGTNIFIPSTFIINQMENQGTYVDIHTHTHTHTHTQTQPNMLTQASKLPILASTK